MFVFLLPKVSLRMTQISTFEILFSTDFAEWRRYDIFIMGTCSDAAGECSGFVHAVSRGAEEHTPEAPHNRLKITGIHCAGMELYIYVVANALPASNRIGDNPPFECRLEIRRDGETAYDKIHMINQWGGETIHITI